MRKLYLALTLCVLFFSTSEIKAEVGQGVIKFKTDKAVGSTISMEIFVYDGLDDDGDVKDANPEEGTNISFEGATKKAIVQQKVYLTITSPEITIRGDVNYLTIVGQEIKDIDVSGASKLTTLRVNENPLTTLDLSNNAALTEVWATACSDLTSVKLAPASALMTLSLQGTQVANLNLSQAQFLRTLHVGDNPNLTTIDLSQLTELEELWINGNGIEALDLTNNTNLTTLECSRNLLTTLDLSGKSDLNYVSCWCNKLKGEGLNALIQSLTKETEGEERELCVYNGLFENEQNELTDEQIAAIKARGWTPKQAKGNKEMFAWVEITSAVTGIDAVSVKANDTDKWFDLMGRRIAKPTAKGIYIHNGKKILLK